MCFVYDARHLAFSIKLRIEPVQPCAISSINMRCTLHATYQLHRAAEKQRLSSITAR